MFPFNSKNFSTEESVAFIIILGAIILFLFVMNNIVNRDRDNKAPYNGPGVMVTAKIAKIESCERYSKYRIKCWVVTDKNHRLLYGGGSGDDAWVGKEINYVYIPKH